MNQPTDASKAAAALVFTSGVPDYDTALALYDALKAGGLSADAVLDKFPGVYRWENVEQMTDKGWWDEIEALAHNIDGCRTHFEPNHELP